MGLETATYINGLVATNPVNTDDRSQGDDHLRLIKAAILNTFPNVTGAVTATHSELNYVGGVTSAIQTQLDSKQASSTRLTDLSGLSAAQATALLALSTFATTLLDDTNQKTALTTLGALLNSVNSRASAYAVATTDQGKLIDCTTGTWALTFAPGTLGANFACAVRNSGTGVITLTPSTGTIDGAATLALAAGSSALIFCDGTNLETIGHAGTLALATASNDGQMSAAYAAKLDGIAAGATVGVPVDAGVLGLGSFALMSLSLLSSLASGATAAGSSLISYLLTDSAGTRVISGTVPTGTWRNISGHAIGYSGGMTYYGLCQRIA